MNVTSLVVSKMYTNAFVLIVAFILCAMQVHSTPKTASLKEKQKHPEMAWPNFRFNQQNTGFFPSPASQINKNPRVNFFQTEGLIWSTPVFDSHGNLYVGSADKFVYALNPQGRLLWKYKIFDMADSLIDSACLLSSQGLLVVPGGDGFLHALDQKTGKLKWTFKAYHVDDSIHLSGVAVNSFEGNVTEGPSGLIYAGSDNGVMYAIDQQGKMKWYFQTNMMIWSSPAFHPTENWMVFGSLDGFVYVLDALTGELIDKFKTTGEVKASPAIDLDGTIYVGSSAGTFYAFNLVNAKSQKKLQVKWSYEFFNEIYSSAALSESAVYFGVSDGNFYSLDKNGKKLWSYFTSARILSSPVLTSDGAVLFGARNGKIYALNSSSGERLWSFKTTDTKAKSNLDSSIAISPTGKLAVGSYNGKIHLVDFNFCPNFRTDPRCEFGGTSDHPDFGSTAPTNGSLIQFEDRKGNWIHDLKDPVGLTSALRFRLLAFENNQWIENASINPLSFKFSIEPKLPVEVKISGDGRAFSVVPLQPMPENQKFKITVKGNYFHQTHWFLDRWKWLGLNKFEGSLEFATTNLVGKPASFTEDHHFGIDNLFLFQPEALETYTPAAIDGQVFWVRIFAKNENQKTFLASVIPVTKATDHLKVLYEPNRSFVLSGKYHDRFIKMNGSYKIAAMGGEIPFEKSYYFAELDQKGLPQRGEFVTESPCWGLRGSGNSFQFPMQLADLVCDHLFYMITAGKFESFDNLLPKYTKTLSVDVQKTATDVVFNLRSNKSDAKLVHIILVDELDSLIDSKAIKMSREDSIKIQLPTTSFKTYIFENGTSPILLNSSTSKK
jgi:outer membrane protein assembly factor BamB